MADEEVSVKAYVEPTNRVPICLFIIKYPSSCENDCIVIILGFCKKELKALRSIPSKCVGEPYFDSSLFGKDEEVTTQSGYGFYFHNLCRDPYIHIRT